MITYETVYMDDPCPLIVVAGISYHVETLAHFKVEQTGEWIDGYAESFEGWEPQRLISELGQTIDFKTASLSFRAQVREEMNKLPAPEWEGD